MTLSRCSLAVAAYGTGAKAAVTRIRPPGFLRLHTLAAFTHGIRKIALLTPLAIDWFLLVTHPSTVQYFSWSIAFTNDSASNFSLNKQLSNRILQKTYGSRPRE